MSEKIMCYGHNYTERGAKSAVRILNKRSYVNGCTFKYILTSEIEHRLPDWLITEGIKNNRLYSIVYTKNYL